MAMKKILFALGILYLLQTAVIWPTCFIDIHNLYNLPVWSQDDSFGAAALILVYPVEGLFFLFFFVSSLGATVLLLKRKRLGLCMLFAALGCIPAIVCWYALWARRDYAWVIYPGAEILLGVVTIFVLCWGLVAQPDLRGVEGGCKMV